MADNIEGSGSGTAHKATSLFAQVFDELLLYGLLSKDHKKGDSSRAAQAIGSALLPEAFSHDDEAASFEAFCAAAHGLINGKVIVEKRGGDKDDKEDGNKKDKKKKVEKVAVPACTLTQKEMDDAFTTYNQRIAALAKYPPVANHHRLMLGRVKNREHLTAGYIALGRMSGKVMFDFMLALGWIKKPFMAQAKGAILDALLQLLEEQPRPEGETNG